MAGQNDFLIFDENSENILTQELYASDDDREDGFKTGLARSNVNNKVLRQTSIMASALGDLVSKQGGQASDTSKSSLVSNLNKLFSIKKYYSDATYDLDDVVIVIGEEVNLYRSLANNNTGNAVSDTTKWENIELGGGASRNIGEIVASTIPLTDAGLHLLDGTLLSGSGSYADFVTYIAGLRTNYSSLFTTESAWQSSVSTYGVCGKFVYNSVNNTVRLPKITGFIEGTNVSSDLGNLVQAGLPNLTGRVGAYVLRRGVDYQATGVFANTAGTAFTLTDSTDSQTGNRFIEFDASNSNAIYGNSNTVQPQSVKVLYYIVIATSTKTSIEVDIDEIATDLNGKADVDLTNVNDTGYIKMAGAGMPSDTYVNLTLGSSGSTYTAPANGWAQITRLITNGYITMSTVYTNSDGICMGFLNTSSTGKDANIYIPVSKGETFKVNYSGMSTGSHSRFVFIYAKGSESEAS